MPSPPPRVYCDLCDRLISPHGHYVVRIDVFAGIADLLDERIGPDIPAVTGEEMEEAYYQHAMAELIEQMKGMSAEELQDQVHRRMEFKLCRPCQMRFLANPLGKPRTRRIASN